MAPRRRSQVVRRRRPATIWRSRLPLSTRAMTTYRTSYGMTMFVQKDGVAAAAASGGVRTDNINIAGQREGAAHMCADRLHLDRASACLCMQTAILLWQIRPSVCPSHCGNISKPMHVSSNSLYRLVGASLYSF